MNDERNPTFNADSFNIILEDAKNLGSLKKSFLRHGVTNIEDLRTSSTKIFSTPKVSNKNKEWVNAIMENVFQTPFSRIKTSINLVDGATSFGYAKGKEKIEGEDIRISTRTTDPQTIFATKKIDRDNILDITDFDVIKWIKEDMWRKLKEELAFAILCGYGPPEVSPYIINENNIRPIAKDEEGYVSRIVFEGDYTSESYLQKLRLFRYTTYFGSGSPMLFIDMYTISDLLSAKDSNGFLVYKSIKEIEEYIGVNKIHIVPTMHANNIMLNGKRYRTRGVLFDPSDYALGGINKNFNMFEDFDIDFNQQKYLIETRCSGALTSMYSSIVALEAI